jgi:hypothetical protein
VRVNVRHVFLVRMRRACGWADPYFRPRPYLKLDCLAARPGCQGVTCRWTCANPTNACTGGRMRGRTDGQTRPTYLFGKNAVEISSDRPSVDSTSAASRQRFGSSSNTLPRRPPTCGGQADPRRCRGEGMAGLIDAPVRIDRPSSKPQPAASRIPSQHRLIPLSETKRTQFALFGTQNGAFGCLIR